MRRSILGCLVGVVAFGLLASLPSVAEEIIYFQSGRTMPVVSHKVEGNMVYVDLGDEKTLAFPMSIVERIEEANANVMIKQSQNPYGQRRVPNPNGSYPIGGQARKRNREAIPNQESQATNVVVDEKTGVAAYRPMGRSAGENKRNLAISGNMRAMSGTVQNGGNGRIAGTQTVGTRHVIGGTTPRRSNRANPKRPPLVGLEYNPSALASKTTGNAAAATGKGEAATSGRDAGPKPGR